MSARLRETANPPASKNTRALGPSPVGGWLDPPARALLGRSLSDQSVAMDSPSRFISIQTFRPDDKDHIDRTSPDPPHLLRFSSRSRDTYDERMRNGLFGLTQQSWSFVKDIKPGMPLFLYNLSEKKFQGVFEAVSTHPKHRARAPAPHLVALSFWDKPPRRASAAWELFRSFSWARSARYRAGISAIGRVLAPRVSRMR